MAGTRKPGPQCTHNDPIEINDGTLCLAQMPPPGPLGISFDDRNQPLTTTDTSQQDIEIALSAIRRETGTEIGAVLRSRIPELIAILDDLRTNATYPYAEWDTSALAPPIRRIANVKDILVLLGLDFLPPSINRGSAELIFALTKGPAGWAPDVAAHQSDTSHVARAAGILVRLILQGIVRYVPAGTNRVRRAIAAWESRTNSGASDAGNNTRSVLLARLRISKFGEPFAAWINQNWDALLKNPRLRPEIYIGEGSIHTIASNSVTLKESNATVAPAPAEDPPTFPPDVNPASQAAALIAAASQGTPFCPI